MLESSRIRCKSAEYKDATQGAIALRVGGIVGKRKHSGNPECHFLIGISKPNTARFGEYKGIEDGVVEGVRDVKWLDLQLIGATSLPELGILHLDGNCRSIQQTFLFRRPTWK